MRNEMLLILAAGPFLYYATLDNIYHFRKRRKITIAEHLTHLVIGLALFSMFRGFWINSPPTWSWGLAGVACYGAIDEYLFHRGIGELESDLHAKAHWALVVFLAVALFSFRG